MQLQTTKQPLEKQFWKFVLPSILTMVLGGFYGIIDGYFIGNAVGDDGLAAINLIWPLTALILATGTGLGVGGAVLMATKSGEGRQKDAASAKGNCFFLLLVLSFIYTVGLTPAVPWIVSFLGATGKVAEYCVDYARIVTLGASLQIIGVGLTPILRNLGRTVLAMTAMISGFVTNIILDALFIMKFDWALSGAALATVAGEGLVAVLCLWAIFSNKESRIKLEDIKPLKKTLTAITRIGLSPFGSSLAPSFVIMICNWQCIRYGGNLAVASYSVLTYLLFSSNALMSGVGQGIQPIISHANGAKQYAAILAVKRKALFLIVTISAILFLLCIPAQTFIPKLFGLSSDASVIFAKSLWISSFAFPFIGLVKLGSEFFCAINNTRNSSLLIYCDPLLLSPLAFIILPLAFKLDGVWLALPTVQIILAVIAGGMFYRYEAKLKYINHIIQKSKSRVLS